MTLAESPMGGLIFLLLAGLAVLLAVLALPLARGRVRPNALYGVRTPISLSSEVHWYAMNRLGGRTLRAAAGLLAVLAPVALLLSEDSVAVLVLLGFAPVPLLVGAALHTFIRSARWPADPEELTALLPDETQPG